MSAAILWKPENPKENRRFNIPAPSTFLESMKYAGFGDREFVLTESNIPTLIGMAAVFGENSPNPYSQIVEVIRRHGAIRVWAEY